ncbi:hypothetical protein [Leuconostoc fallax]|uniref:Uncharacterized protein n=1 Tax=Leuconostoc fallax TaxID=1251 RepID=A0A4R5N876_9LACO|nr:hypothetical protein [Leuconostoc fallax]MBU7455868.1 hypothetical protein [Leuconostoc fallax]TDG68047.1 hypothetical protein C5L23_000353 [Leuconostoc fallax]
MIAINILIVVIVVGWFIYKENIDWWLTIKAIKRELRKGKPVHFYTENDEICISNIADLKQETVWWWI